METLLPIPGLRAKPVDKNAPITVRIASEQPHGTQARYDLRYIGAVPGGYDLRDFLMLADGTAAPDLPPLPVQIAGVLPAQHDGALRSNPASELETFGRYKTFLLGAAAFWVLLAVPLFLWGRRGRQAAAAPAVQPTTLAERLRPLVESAARGDLTSGDKARLERLLLGHWRERLGLETVDVHEAMAQLRAHDDAGALLRGLEDWLHRPPGAARVDVEAVLAPYRDLSPPADVREKPARAVAP